MKIRLVAAAVAALAVVSVPSTFAATAGKMVHHPMMHKKLMKGKADMRHDRMMIKHYKADIRHDKRAQMKMHGKLMKMRGGMAGKKPMMGGKTMKGM